MWNTIRIMPESDNNVVGEKGRLISGFDVASFALWSCNQDRVSKLKDELLRAIELALAGQRVAAHEIVQQYEDDAAASWIHAVLHKMEGDLANSGYWYRRAGRTPNLTEEPRVELSAIEATLRGNS
jgi:hypothetical protein